MVGKGRVPYTSEQTNSGKGAEKMFKCGSWSNIIGCGNVLLPTTRGSSCLSDLLVLELLRGHPSQGLET